MNYPGENDLEQTLKIAEFAAQRLENRRQFEFKIFISYMTLLVLAIYEGHHIKVSGTGYEWCVFVLLFIMHLFYLTWTISMSVAMQNDSNRKNFYLSKAEYISDNLLKRFGDPLCRKLKNDYSQICPNENEIKKVPKGLTPLIHLNQIWRNWATAFQVVLPTIIFFLLVFNVSKKLSWILNILFMLIPFILLFFIVKLITYFKEKSRK